MRLEGRDASRVGMLLPPRDAAAVAQVFAPRSHDFNSSQERAGPFWGKDKMKTLRVSTRTQTLRVEIETRVIHKCSHK